MKIILFVCLILSLCTSRYISTSDINLSSLTSDLKALAPYPRAMVREALGKSLIASLSNMADRFDESTSKTVTRQSIIGDDEEVLILSYKIAKDFILHLNIIEFSDEQIQREILDAKEKIAKCMDDFLIKAVEETLQIAINEELLEEYQKTEVQQKRMRSEPFYHYLDYKTYAWMLAVNGDDFLWEEKIQEFDDWTIQKVKVEVKTDL